MFGEVSKSIKIYLDFKSTNFINNVTVHNLKNQLSLSFITDEGSFVPYVIILPSTNKLRKNNIDVLKSFISSIDGNIIPGNYFSSCSMLLPSNDFSNNRIQTLITAVKNLAIQLH